MNDNLPTSHLLGKPFLEGKHPMLQLLCLAFLTLACGIVISIFGIIIAYGIWNDTFDTPTTGQYQFLQFFNTTGIFLVPALLFAYLMQRRWFTYNNANRLPGSAKAVMYVIAAAIFILPTAGLLVELNKMIPWPPFLAGLEEWLKERQAAADGILEKMISGTSISNLLISLLISAVLPAVCEEFYFRGTLQQLIHRWCGNAHIAVWITGFIFSAIHLQIDGFLARWLLGVYLGYLLVWSGSLWLPILAHFLHNAISIILQHIILVRGIAEESTQCSSDIIYSLIALVLLSTLVYLIYKSLHKKQPVSNS